MAGARPVSADVPRPSSTVVLLRDAPLGPEVLLVLRHARSAFGSTYVFPGGVIEDDDHRVEHHCAGHGNESSDALLGVQGEGIAYFSAAIRELFEEAGVLLARSASGIWADTSALADDRAQLNAANDGWLPFLKRHDLRLAADALHYFSFWVTPRGLPKRFTTRFFAAALPEGQEATHCGIELTDSRWVAPHQALKENARGQFALPQPTLVTMRALSQFSSISAVLDWTAEQRLSGVERVLPVFIHQDGEKRVLMPGDADYPPGGGEP